MHRRLLYLTHGTLTALIITILTGLAAGLLTIGQSYALSASVNDVFLRGRTLSEVWPWIQTILVIVITRAVLAWINEIAASGIAVHIKTTLREKLLAHILALGPAYARGQRTGELTTAAVEGIEALDAYFSQYLPQLVISTLVPVSILIIVFPLDLLSGILLLLTAPLIPFFMYMIGRGAEALTRRQYKTLSRLSAHFLDSLQGLTTLKLFGQSKAQARNIARVGDQYRDATLRVLRVTFLSAFALELLATISTAIIAVEVGLRLLYGQMPFQQALFLLILAPEFYLPLRMLGLRFHAGMAGTSAARRIFEILDTPLARSEDIAPTKAGGTTSANSRYPFSSLELIDLSYTYPGEQAPTLRNVALKIGAGQHIALVGPSGAGKTTLSSILLRFMAPSSGRLLINGKPASNMRADDWRSLIAWVPQNPHFFHDTIAANIRIGNAAATDEEVEAAARSAHLDQFVRALPQKYQTQIGEAGARLSSGQAQRLALARAFLKNAPILILDEPTSNLDPGTEALLEDSTRRLMQGRTVITIAHRLNTVVHADEILVLRDGRIVERGTHLELSRANGHYAGTIRIQDPTTPMLTDYPNPAKEGREEYHPEDPAYPSVNPARWLEGRSSSAGDNERSTFFRLLSFLRGSWSWVALSVLLGSLTIGSSLALMGTSAWLISMAALHPSIAVLQVAIVGVRFFGLTRAVFRYLERLVSHNVTFGLLGQLRTWFYERLEPLAPARLMEYKAGDLLARVIGDVNTLENFYVRVLAPPATALLIGIGVTVFLTVSDARLSLIPAVSFLLLGVGLPTLVRALNSRTGRDLVLQRSELNALLVDGIQGLPDLIAFGQEPDRLAQLHETGRRNSDTQHALAKVSGLNSGVVTFLTNLAPWLVLLIAIPEVSSGRIAGVMLAPLILVTMSAFEAVSPLPVAAHSWSSTRAAARRLFAVVDTEPAVSEQQPATAEPKTRGGSGCLEFANLSFTYPRQAEPALRNVSFRIQTGEKLAVIGPSGAGKSTLASLLLRFWEFDQGRIYFNGRSIQEYVPEQVREQVALVSPNTYFFNTSIFENLRMARRGATRLEVERAARDAQIDDFIKGLPYGYDTLIGENGVRLSAGERQRLAIARTILKDASLLLLDEPTANLDALVESQVLTTLLRIMEGRSCLLITHRLVGLERMDQILVLEHGCITDHGTHADLSQRDGPYRCLRDLQNRFLKIPAAV